MPTVVARFAGLLLIPLLLASFAAASDPATDEARFHYLHGFEASGDFEGTCEVAGFRFDTGIPGSLAFRADQAKLTVLQTWRNSTVVGEPFPRELLVETEQSSRTYDLPPGPIGLEWGSEAHLYLSKAYLDEERVMTASLDGSRWDSSKIRNGVPAGPGYYYVHDEQADSHLKLPSRIAGPSRVLSSDQTTTNVHGDGFFRFDRLTLTAGEDRFELPPYKQYHRDLETPVSYSWSVLHTNGILEVKGLDLTVSRAQGDLVCGDLEWAGTGSITYRAATGNVTQAGTLHEFKGRELTLHGTWTTLENTEYVPTSWGHQRRANTWSVGQFAGGVDYQPLSAAGGSLRLPEQITLLGSLIGLALVLWKLGPTLVTLFTRVQPDRALEHPVRELIHETARSRPGSCLADLVRETGQSYSTIQHHARLLARLEWVALIRFGREVHVFPAKTSRSRARRIVSLRTEPVRRLMDLVGDRRRRLREVRAALQSDFRKGPSWATRIVGQAERAGLVERQKTENGVMLCAKES